MWILFADVDPVAVATIVGTLIGTLIGAIVAALIKYRNNESHIRIKEFMTLIEQYKEANAEAKKEQLEDKKTLIENQKTIIQLMVDKGVLLQQLMDRKVDNARVDNDKK